MDVKRIGVLAILGSSMMWALEPICAKFAYRDSDFLQTSTVRAIVIAFVSLLYVALTNKGSLRVKRTQVPKLVYIALAGTIAADTFYFYSLSRVGYPVVNAVLIAHMQPIFIVLFGFFVLRESLTRFDYAGIAVMIISGLIVMTGTVENLIGIKLGRMGDVYVLFATVFWATTAIAMKKYLADVNSGVITFYRFSIASIIFTIYLLVRGPEIRLNIYQVVIGVISAAGTILYYEALKRIKAAQVSALELSTPLFAAILVMFVPDETVTGMQLVGILLLFVGVHLLSRTEKQAVTFIGD